MALSAKHSGAWKEASAVSARHSGAWKAGTVFAKSGGVWEQVYPEAGFDPATMMNWWEYRAAKTGWVTEVGGDGNTYFVSAPNLGSGSAGTSPGFFSGASSADHTLALPAGWRVNDAAKGLELTAVAERSFKTSNGSADVVGTGSFFEVLVFVDGGSSSNNTLNGSGTLFPVAKYETVSTVDRLKYTDGFNTLENGTGTVTVDAIFNFSPQPAPPNVIFLAFQRDVANKKLDFWFGLLSQEFSAIQKTNSKLLTTPLFLTNPRNDTQVEKTYFLDEGAILMAKGRHKGLKTDADVEVIFNHAKTLLP